jgi:hypothetical protein
MLPHQPSIKRKTMTKRKEDKDEGTTTSQVKTDDTIKNEEPTTTTTTTTTQVDNAIDANPSVGESSKGSSLKVESKEEATTTTDAAAAAANDAPSEDTNQDVAMTEAAAAGASQTDENLLSESSQVAPAVPMEEETIAMFKATEDAVALAAMQEAATIVMEAAEHQKKRKLATEDTSSEGASNKKRSPPTRVSWEDRMKQLTEYKAEHGDLLIPIRYKLNPSLGKFVHNTREQYKLYHKQTPEGYKKKCSLTSERIRQLEELGFAWTTQRIKHQNEDWQSRLEQLKLFRKDHGHCLVPHGYTKDAAFAEWIHRQRTTYASLLKDEKVTEVVKLRMEQLKELGFNFTVHSDKWMDHWEQLKEFKEKNGVSCLVVVVLWKRPTKLFDVY